MMARICLLFILFMSFGVVVKAQNPEIPVNTRFYYNGTVEKIDHIQMNLHIIGYEVSGAFVMESSGEQYFVQGRLSQNKDGIGIRVYNSLDKYIASIEANIISEETNFANKMVGIYKPAGESQVHKLLLQKIAEFATTNRNLKKSNITFL